MVKERAPGISRIGWRVSRRKMFCPKCKAEYRVGFTRCSDCHIDLVDQLPPEKPTRKPLPDVTIDARRFGPDPELVAIRTYSNNFDADFAKSVLDAAGIECVIKGSQHTPYHAGIALGQGLELVVRAEDAEDADRILETDVTDETDPD